MRYRIAVLAIFVIALLDVSMEPAASVQRPRYTITNGAVSLYFFNFEARFCVRCAGMALPAGVTTS